MATPTTPDLLKYVSLQMAAEAFLADPITGKPKTDEILKQALIDGNGHASKFTDIQATDFLKHWQIVDQKANTSTGFSGTLFRNKDTNELVMSMRSTEFIDDAARDGQATNTLEIKEKGWAFGQIADMEKWYADIKTQYAGDFATAGNKFAVTGYSLGGHLATAFNLLRKEDADLHGVINPTTATYTFNGAGVGTVNAGTLTDIRIYNLFERSLNMKTMKSFLGQRFYIPLALRSGTLMLAIAAALTAGCASSPSASVASTSPVAAQSMQTRQQIAQAMFAERCKTAGEKIYKTVENVDGIYLMKMRTTTNFNDQFKLDDPYGHDSMGDMYLQNFLRGFYHQRNEAAVPGAPPRLGYLYVEAQDAEDGQRYRYTGRIEQPWLTNKHYLEGYQRFVMDSVPVRGAIPRYGVTFDDISTHEEREYWIAGSSLKVIDLQTKEILAERIGYMVDWAQGSSAGGRSPWLFAADNACPGFQWNPNFPVTRNNGGGSSQQPGQTLTFVEKVLKPAK